MISSRRELLALILTILSFTSLLIQLLLGSSGHYMERIFQTGVDNKKYDLDHLTQRDEYVYGPIQDDEALFLYGLIKSIRPRVVVEAGMGHGHSSTNILKALDADSLLFTYDIVVFNKSAHAFHDSRFKLVNKSQSRFEHSDIDFKRVDLAYLDNGHYLNVEKEFWQRILPVLAPDAIVAIHDTGLHVNAQLAHELDTCECVCEFERVCGFMHCPPERLFVNWIIEKYPEWSVMHIHSFNVYRHGLTILQRKRPLETKPKAKKYCTKNGQI